MSTWTVSTSKVWFSKYFCFGLGRLGLGLLSLGWLLIMPLNFAAAEPRPLEPIPLDELPSNLGLDDGIGTAAAWRGDRSALLAAIDHSLTYLKTPTAAKIYRRYPVPGITLTLTQRSLRRFRQLLRHSPSPSALQAAVQREFILYQAVGKDGQGTVAFTGYFEPQYAASPTPTALYPYPIYRLPPDLAQWPQPHPTRLTLEGRDGLQGHKGLLRGQALAWLQDRLEAFLVQVQGSAQLQFPNGEVMTVGYAGRTDYPYTSIGGELVKDGKIALEDLTLPAVIAYFQDHPQALDDYLPRNQRFIFFQETQGAPARGSLGVPVTSERSIATDKSLMPPGALALIRTHLPTQNGQGEWVLQPTSRYVLDQDTGGAIQGPGRVDIFMGTGSTAGDRAGLINSEGQLYYLMLRDQTTDIMGAQ